jgi:hypothetical protein
MRTLLVTIGVGAALLTGCGREAVQRGAEQVSLHVSDANAPVVGKAQVLAVQVNPMQRLAANASGEQISVTYGRLAHDGNILGIDPGSLHLRAVGSSGQYTDPTQSEAGADNVQRIALANGTSLVLWTGGSVEWGHRAMAQAMTADGRPQGAPFVLSPADMDVFSAPSAATTDGHRVVATFSGTRRNAFELVAVPIDLGEGDGASQTSTLQVATRASNGVE